MGQVYVLSTIQVRTVPVEVEVEVEVEELFATNGFARVDLELSVKCNGKDHDIALFVVCRGSREMLECFALHWAPAPHLHIKSPRGRC